MNLKLLTALLLPLAAALSHENSCLRACVGCLVHVPFADAAPGILPVEQRCYSLWALKSTYVCMREHCEEDARREIVRQRCEAEHNVTVPSYGALMGNYTDGDVARLKRVSLEDVYAPGEKVQEVLVPEEWSFTRWRETLKATEIVYDNHYNYGWAMIIFWIVVVAMGMVNRLIVAISHMRKIPSDEKKPVSTWFRRTISLPATFGHRRAQSIWWCTIPPRLQTLTITAFLIINIVLSIHGYYVFPGNIYYPTVLTQYLRYVSDRTGIISYANFPVIWLFGMRNNLLLWLTGWDFGAYNNFHRWVARIATAQAVVHSVGYTVLIFIEGGWQSYKMYWTTFMFWWAGQVATIGMCALLGLSIYWIRRKQYEIFLVLHILISILVLVTMLGHVSIFNGVYDPPFWISVFIWIADRIIRTLRIFAFNVKPWTTQALATYNPSSNIVRLNIPSQTSLYTPQPGTFYFLMVLDDPRCWESHPFTVALPANRNAASVKTLGEEAPLLVEHDDSTTPAAGEPAMTFLIRPYDSFTRRLRDKAEAEWPRAASMRVLVEGPYGSTHPLHRFQHVLFLTGGSGIVVPLSYLQVLTDETKQRPEHVQIHWSVREQRLAEEVLAADFGEAIQSDNLAVDIYNTLSAPVERDPRLARVRVHPQRLNVDSAVQEAVLSAGKQSLAVVACGPAGLADDARRAVVRMLERGYGGVEYFEESFQW